MREDVLKNIFIVLVLAVIAAGVVWNYETIITTFGGENSKQAGQNGSKAAIKVLTQAVDYTSNDRIYEGVGTGRARASADIYPAVADEVLSVNFEAQQKVSKGDVLVQLDDRQEKLAVELAEVELKDSRSLLDRYEQAGKQGAVPESEVDSARATFESAKVALEQAKLNLEERKIIAPFDGYVGIPSIDPGDRVNTDTLITGLDDREILYIDFEVPEALASALKKAQDEKQEITATTPSYPDETFTGFITAQESRINPDRRTITARASIENEEDLLRPGMSFTVSWDIAGKEFPTVPEISVQWSRDGSFIWIIRDDKADKVMGRVVARKAGQVLLDIDVKEGEPVVVEGLQRLRPGADVEVLNNQNQGES